MASNYRNKGLLRNPSGIIRLKLNESRARSGGREFSLIFDFFFKSRMFQRCESNSSVGRTYKRLEACLVTYNRLQNLLLTDNTAVQYCCTFHNYVIVGLLYSTELFHEFILILSLLVFL